MIIKRHKTELPKELIISHDKSDEENEFKKSLQLMKYCDGILNISNVTHIRKIEGKWIAYTNKKDGSFIISNDDYRKLLHYCIL